MLVAGDVLSFNNVWRNQNFFYNITGHINTNYFHCRGHQSSHSSCTLRVRYLKQIWSRGHNIRDQGLKKKSEAKKSEAKTKDQGPKTKKNQVQTLSRPRAELVKAKAKDQGQNFKKSYGRQTLTVFKRESVRHCISLSFS